MNIRRHVSGCTVALLAAAAADAQQPITLQHVLDVALTASSQTRVGRLRVEAARGQVLAAAAPFDLQLQSDVRRGRDNQQMQATQFAPQELATYSVSAARRFHNGVTVSPTVDVSRSQLATPGALATGNAAARVDIVIPMLYDRGGAVTATAQRVAELQLGAAHGAWRSIIAKTVYELTVAYWDYVAAGARLEAQRDAEARAQRLLDESIQLVEKQERAPADLQQLRATLASKQGGRIVAEQTVVEARAQLGLAMGLEPAAVIGLPTPATGFPTPSADTTPVALAVARLLDTAIARRPDRAQQQATLAAWTLELREFRDASLPRFDLVLSVGYQGVTQGPGFNHLVSPLYRNVPGMNAAVSFHFGGLVNSAARGLLMQEGAGVDENRLALRDVERRLSTEVHVAALGVDRARAALVQSERAVALYRITVDNEQRKLRLGMNTLFDVLNAEDALTNALIAVINNRRAYAVALASLRLATGTIVDVIADVPHADSERLRTTP
jgi:outer membrane protein TolC